MLAATALNTLLDHQKSAQETMRRAEPLLAGAGPAAAAELSRLRWELCRQLRAYQLFKHTEVLDPIIARGTPERARLAREIKARCLAVDQAWREHVMRWTATGVVQQWPAYSAAALGQVAGLKRHLVRERRDVEALLAGQPRTRSPVPGPVPAGSRVR